MKVTKNDIPDDLLLRYLTGKAMLHEKLQVEKWLDTNEANRQYFERLKTSNEPHHTQLDDNDAEAWIRLQNLISKNHGGHIDKPEYKFKARWVQLAVTVILISLMAFIIRRQLYSNLTLNLITDANITTETLPDGTTVTLNTNSQLSYPARFTGSKRLVRLTGEAFFEINPDKAKPFVIKLKNMALYTTQASLDVKISNGQTVITVVKGLVKINNNGKELLIKADEKVTANANASSFVKEINNGKNPAIWAIAHE